ncbi:MAG TPA: MlaD family protein [Candidatus Sulfotelmatobacter sp.]|nr:MlaD family protein [Candidatus Sulfotelmatobacter sp.]
MSRPINNFKLGLFTLCGLAIIVAGLLAFGARSYFQPSSEFETYIAGDVTGLSVGSGVELRGVNVGKVTGIDFSWTEYEVSDPSYIVVQFKMRNDIEPRPSGTKPEDELQAAIQRGLRARIKTKGITGASVLSLEYVDPIENPPIRVPWTPKNTYIPSAPGEFSELLASVEKVLRNVQNLDLKAMNQLLDTDLQSAGRVLDHAEQFDFASLSTNANSLLIDVRGSNARLKTLLDDTDNTVTRLKLQKLTQDLDTLANQLQDTVSRIEPGVANINFDQLNDLLTKAHQTINSLDETLTELKEYPSGFIFGTPPAPVKGIQK